MQNELFHERIEDALDEVIRHLGGRKKVACDMWPDKPPREAHNLMDACLNHERRERFTPSQVIYLAKKGREIGCHSFMQWFGQECGYEVKAVSRAAEVDRLTSVVESSAQTLRSALATLERIHGKGLTL